MTIELTGIVGTLFTWTVLIISCAIILIGSFNIASWIIEKMLNRALRYLKLFQTVVEFFYYYKAFKKWLADQQIRESFDRQPKPTNPYSVDPSKDTPF